MLDLATKVIDYRQTELGEYEMHIVLWGFTKEQEDLGGRVVIHFESEDTLTATSPFDITPSWDYISLGWWPIHNPFDFDRIVIDEVRMPWPS